MVPYMKAVCIKKIYISIILRMNDFRSVSVTYIVDSNSRNRLGT